MEIEEVLHQIDSEIDKAIFHALTQSEIKYEATPTDSIAEQFAYTFKDKLKQIVSNGVGHSVYLSNYSALFGINSPQFEPVHRPAYANAEHTMHIVDQPQLPSFKYDNGFLDKFSPRRPSLQDINAYRFWKLRAFAAKVFYRELDDAVEAYKHFLGATGTHRKFDLHEYIQEDPKGQALYHDAIKEAKYSIKRKIKKSGSYLLSSRGLFASESNNLYPATENWQKAIGAFNYSIHALVIAQKEGDLMTYNVAMTIHAEDKYNFNPGQNDLATGIPDSENGRFELTGQAQQFMQSGSYTFKIQWSDPEVRQF